jgi:uncharacterized protein (DUF697 family)
MKRARHTRRDILHKLRLGAADRALGRTVREVCKKLEISQATYHRWKREYHALAAYPELAFSNHTARASERRNFDEKQERDDWWPLMDLIGHQIRERGATIAAVLAHMHEAIRKVRSLSQAAQREVLARLENIVVSIPETHELESNEPLARCRVIITDAAIKAATLSGGLALPLGPLGALTLLPDLVLIWKVQAQMVADIAGAFGREGMLTREHMIYCLCKHATSQAVRELAIRTGRRAMMRTGRGRFVRRLVGSFSMPILGAAGAAAFAYFDTARVGRMAIQLFSQETDARSRQTRNEAVI